MKHDWTSVSDGEGGYATNSSSKFVRLCDEVERLIRNEAYTLISGRADLTARLIMAQLAHVHGLAPTMKVSYAND